MMTLARRTLEMVAILALCSACTAGNGSVTFCDRYDGFAFLSRAFTLDLKARHYSAFDVASGVTIVTKPGFYGIMEPFPMVVPSNRPVDTRLPYEWTMDGYHFVARPGDEPGRIIVAAVPLQSAVAQVGGATRILDYSYTRGVISYTTQGLVAGKKHMSTAYPCFGQKLDLLAIGPR